MSKSLCKLYQINLMHICEKKLRCKPPIFFAIIVKYVQTSLYKHGNSPKGILNLSIKTKYVK